MQNLDHGIVEGSLKAPVNYVHLLPIELWRDIFLLAVPPNATPLLIPTTFFDGDLLPRNYKSLLHLQHQRAQLRGLCKALEPVILELLLHEVVLYSSWITRFYYALEKMGSKSWNPGVLTRRVTILIADILPSDARADPYAQLGRLSEYCPNSRVISTFIYIRSTVGPYPTDVGWVHHVTQAILQLPLLSTNCLVALADRNPDLETLALIAKNPEKTQANLQTDVSFPHLQRLFISCDDIFAHLSAPKLRWLGLGLCEPSNQGLSGFLSRNGTNLTYLHLIITERMEEELPWVLDLLYLCPRLQTLSLDGRGSLNDDTNPRAPHPSLKHLVLRCQNPFEIVDWLETFGLAPEWHPLLSFLTITARIFRLYRRDVTFYDDKGLAAGAVEEYCRKLGWTLVFKEVS